VRLWLQPPRSPALRRQPHLPQTSAPAHRPPPPITFPYLYPQNNFSTSGASTARSRPLLGSHGPSIQRSCLTDGPSRAHTSVASAAICSRNSISPSRRLRRSRRRRRLLCKTVLRLSRDVDQNGGVGGLTYDKQRQPDWIAGCRRFHQVLRRRVPLHWRGINYPARGNPAIYDKNGAPYRASTEPPPPSPISTSYSTTPATLLRLLASNCRVPLGSRIRSTLYPR